MKKIYNVITSTGEILAKGVSDRKANRVQNNANCETIRRISKL